MTHELDLPQTIRVIRTKLCTRTPFFGSLALFAEVLTSETMPTAATDGRRILINPQFFAQLSPSEQEGVFLHEVLHAALLHVPRGHERQAERWNIAADIVVNGILAKEGYTLPDNSVREPQLEHFSVEEVYDLLQQQSWIQRNFQLENPDLLAGSVPGNRPAQAIGQIGRSHQTALQDYWNSAREQSSIMAESAMFGSLPASLQREVAQLQVAQLNWRHHLWRYLVRTPIDFSGFDRRFIGQKMYLDTLEGETVYVAVAVDTSGSIRDRQIQAFLSEVREILQAYPHLRCDLYYVDTIAHGPYRLVANAAIPAPVGGGGTDFRPFFDGLARDHEPWTTTIAVYLTDGYGRFPEAPPSYPVLWVVTAGGLDIAQFPFGEVVKLVGDT